MKYIIVLNKILIIKNIINYIEYGFLIKIIYLAIIKRSNKINSQF